MVDCRHRIRRVSDAFVHRVTGIYLVLVLSESLIIWHRFVRKFRKLALSRSCEYALIRWMLLCVGLGSFLLLYNEVDNNGGQYITVREVMAFTVLS